MAASRGRPPTSPTRWPRISPDEPGRSPDGPDREAPPGAGPAIILQPGRHLAGVLHGRRQGRRLRDAPTDTMERLLPRCAVRPDEVADVERLFAPPVTGLRLEVGFGGGEHVHAQAQRHPEIGFIACEPFRNGVASLMQHLDEAWCPNIRVFPGDGGAIVDRLPDAALSRVDLLYPDPWPKRRQRKRRFVSTDMLKRLARVMAPGAFFRFATDIDDYAGWALARVVACPSFTWVADVADDWRRPWPDWVSTRYEAKALRAGRRPVYLTFRRH